MPEASHPSSSPAPPEIEQPTPEELVAAQQFFMSDPRAAARELAQLRRTQQRLQADCLQSAEAAAAMHGALAELLRPKAALYHLERWYYDDHGELQAVVNFHGEQREMAVSREVDVEQLEALKPWEFVRVHPAEMIVVGTYTEAALFREAQGDVATFKGFRDAERGTATVSRAGREDEIVFLAPNLRDAPLAPGARLILQRDNPRWAIDVVPAQQTQSRFEMPVTAITARLDELAGLDAVITPIMEDLLTRLIYPELTAKFALKPLRGMILHSEKPGMGKTALLGGLVYWLYEYGQQRGFDVVFYNIPPNAMKSLWHGEDARIVREEVFGPIRMRLQQPRSRPLILLCGFDEAESLGRRSGLGSHATSPAHNDVVQALLAEMDGIQALASSDGPPASAVFVGLTNQLSLLDEALRRPGRMGDLIQAMPDYNADAAAEILGVYARCRTIPWYLDGEVRQGLAPQEIMTRILRPVIARVFPTVVLHYFTEAPQGVSVSAGEVLAGVHYQAGMNRAKRQAAVRELRRVGVPAITADDLIAGLMEEAHAAAQQLAADPQMLARQLHVRVPVLRAELAAGPQWTQHQYARPAGD